MNSIEVENLFLYKVPPLAESLLEIHEKISFVFVLLYVSVRSCALLSFDFFAGGRFL